jgi:hyperosmotically inducible protein
MKISKTTAAALTVCALLGACQKEGPAERAGKQIDQAMNRAGKQIDQAMNKAGKQLDQAANDAGKAMEKAGKKVQRAAKDDKK